MCIGSDCKTAWPTSGSTGAPGAWQTAWTNALAPTSTSAGIFVYASSTFNSTLRVNDTLTVTQASAGTNALVVKAAASATGNLFQLQNSSGTFLSGFTAAGGLLMNISSTTALNVQNGSGSPIFQVNSASTEAGIDVTAVAAQTANLLNIYNSSSQFLSGFTVSGALLINTPSTTALVIQNGSGTNKFWVDSNTGNATTTGNLTMNQDNTFIQWAPDSSGDKFKIQSGTTTLASLDIGGTWKTKGPQTGSTAPDFAEYILSNDNLTVGDIVMMDDAVSSSEPLFIKSNGTSRGKLAGVISGNPSFIAGGSLADENPDNSYLLALAGRVPVKATTLDGAEPIAVGDWLTASSIPGVAQKATSSGMMIGRALAPLANGDGQVLILINTGYVDPSLPVVVMAPDTVDLLVVDGLDDNASTTVAVGNIGDFDSLLVGGEAQIFGATTFGGKVQVNEQAQFNELVRVAGMGSNILDLYSSEAGAVISAAAPQLLIQATGNEGSVIVLQNQAEDQGTRVFIEGPITIGAEAAGTIVTFSYNNFGSGTPGQSAVATSGDVYIRGELEVNGKEYVEGGTSWEKGGMAENIPVRSLSLAEISLPTGDLPQGDNFQVGTTTEEIVGDEEWMALPEAGDVLMVDPVQEFGAVKAFEKNSNKILGIVATDPAGVTRGDLSRSSSEVRPLAVSGSLAVKVSLENGPIKKGDLLTTASRPGYAMKALKPGAGIVGIALEDYLTETASTSTAADLLESAKGQKETERAARAESEIGMVAGATTEKIETAETAELKKSDKILVLLSVKNNVELAWDEVAISVIDNLSLNQEVSVEDYSFEGNVVVKSLVVTGKVMVLGEAEFASAVTMKNNLNLEGALVRIYTEAEGESLTVGDAVYIKGNKLVGKATANVDASLNIFRPAMGMVVGFKESQGNGQRTVEVAVGGAVKGFRDLVPGAVYYLATIDQQQSASLASLSNNTTTVMDIISLSLEKPNAPDGYIQSMALAESEDSLLIMPSLTFEAVDPDAVEASYTPVDSSVPGVEMTESTEPALTEAATSTEPATTEPVTEPVAETTTEETVSEPMTGGEVAGEATTVSEPVVEVVPATESSEPVEVMVVE